VTTHPDNVKAFLAGSMLPDITVAYYFSEGGEVYTATHCWLFFTNVMEQTSPGGEPDPYLQAFAYGIACHLMSDYISHTQLVPERISGYNMPNWLIHPLVEKKYDSLLSLDNPGLKDRSRHMFDEMIDGDRKEELILIVENALGGSAASGIDVQKNVERLAFALDAFYGKEFRPSGGGIFALYPLIDAATDWIYPLSMGSMSDVHHYYDATLALNRDGFSDFGLASIIANEPSGFTDISTADSAVGDLFNTLFFGYIFLIFFLPIFLFWWRRSPWYLLLLPLMAFLLLLVMMIIYILI